MACPCPKCNRGELSVPQIGFLNKRPANFARCSSCRARFGWRELQEIAHELVNDPKTKNFSKAEAYVDMAVATCRYPYHLRRANSMDYAALGFDTDQPLGFGGYLLIAYRAAQLGNFYLAERLFKYAGNIMKSLYPGQEYYEDRRLYDCWLELYHYARRASHPMPEMAGIVHAGLDYCPETIRKTSGEFKRCTVCNSTVGILRRQDVYPDSLTGHRYTMLLCERGLSEDREEYCDSCVYSTGAQVVAQVASRAREPGFEPNPDGTMPLSVVERDGYFTDYTSAASGAR